MSAITAKASQKMKKYAVLTREPRCFLGSFDFSWEQRKLGELALFNPKDELPQTFEYVDLESVVGTEMLSHRTEVKSSAPSRAQRLAHTGDLFYQTVRPYQKNNYLYEKPDNNYVFSTGYAQMRPYVDGYFLLSLVQSERFVKVVLDNCTGTSYPAINANDLAEIEVAAPSDESEAQKIGTIFRSIDNLITLHQRKCALLFSSLQALISMIFTTSTFSWEQRKLGDVVKEITRNDPESEAPIMMITANNGFIEQSERYAFNNAGESLKKYILLKKGELAYNHGASKLRPYGSCFALTTAENARIPFVYHCFSAENQNAEFMSIELNGAEIENQLRKIVSSGARMDGLLNISFDEYTSVSVLLPGTEEQDRIADFFRHLDNLITLHQRECISFAGRAGRLILTANKKRTTSSWEQRKLGDIADIVGGGTPSTGNQSYWDGDIDWYAPAEIADQIYANSSQKKITGLGYENSSAKMLSPGTVLFTSRAGIGKTAILTRKGCTNQGFQSIVPHRGELDSYFIFSRTEELKRYGELVGAGSTFVEVSGKQMAVMELMMPSTMREQQTIGGFFQQLDHLITLHQRKPFLMKWRTSDANRNQTNRLVL